jgi:CXXC motif containing zinc binding protein, eukaryotic
VCALEETQHGKNSFHLVIKDPLNRREATINIVKDSGKPYTEDDNGRWAPVVTFDCRGIEPIEFIPGVCFCP